MRVIALIKASFVLGVYLLLVPVSGYAEDWRWSGVERIVAVSDVHGAYEPFVELLQHAGIVNDEMDWQGNRTHLVIIGDVLDRGPGSRRALELIMQLEPQAEAAGGRVHMVLGNHEVMNLVGDLAYVSLDEFASYQAEEDQSERAGAFARFKAASGNIGTGEEDLIAAFDKEYPSGFFGHRRLFSARGRFGRWLLDKPVLVQINDSVFVHGGLSRAIMETDGAGINNAYAQWLRTYLDDWSELSAAGVLPPEADFYDHAAQLETYLDSQSGVNGTEHSGTVVAARRLVENNASPLFQPESVIWYRGNVMCNAVSAEDEVDAALQHLDVRRLVVGHTPTPDRGILNRFNGKLIRVDTGMLSSYYRGRPAAVVIEHDKVSALSLQNEYQQEPGNQPRKTGIVPGVASDDELERLLAGAPVRERIRQQDGSLLLRLEYQGSLIDSVYVPARNQRRNRTSIPEVAAYRLDRLLGLDLVPVAVRRIIDAVPGAVTVKQDQLLGEPERREKRLGGDAWCPLADQFNLMYVFDILVYNAGRSSDEVRYSTDDWHLVLTGNHRLFEVNNRRPRYLSDVAVSLPDLLAARLRNMDAEQLSRQLGDVLDDKQRQALLKRRDQLLESAIIGVD